MAGPIEIVTVHQAAPAGAAPGAHAPRAATFVNGESFTFAAGAGLIAEATPTMYDDDWVDVHLKYYEDGVTGRRRLIGGNISTTHTRPPEGSPASGGSSGVVISGRRGYAVETNVKAKVL
ncbi:MAG TPA: hypothetical protein VGE08_07400 [Steroidobacter sp.]|uniref:hypothetical protein n=1 Tax=Steroidobacter sp. TaxID=1978227 RepID=UPI002EDB42B4